MSTKRLNQKTDKLEIMRHSLSHLMSMAMQELYPQVGLGVGPAIENGFYQDYGLPETITPEILPQLEKRIKELIKKNIKFGQHNVDFAKAYKFYKHDPYKTGFIDDLKAAGEKKVSFYKSDWFDNLCAGPHVDSTKEINPEAFKLTKIAGAYWRGDEKNKMLQRIYGVAFKTKQELDNYLKMMEEAEKRDHRKLGEKLELFLFHETAPSMPYWLPKGVFVINELINFWRDEHQKRGYQEIISPLINKKQLYVTSGHWEHYLEEMFISKTEDGETYALKAMNCPNAMVVYAVKPRSYKKLPLRLSDTDTLHRYERSGTTYGLLRVREFKQDDAHIFVSEDQIKSEYKNILDIVEKFYSIFNLGYSFRLGTRPEKSMGDKKIWDKAESTLKNILEENGHQFVINNGDGAFYGPKIDIFIKDAIGREWQTCTIQLDFQMPQKFGLKYTDSKGKEKTPVAIHRVIYGSLERFIGILIEHYAGAFPVWLAPEQVWILPIGSRHEDYAFKVADSLKEQNIRVVVKNENETIGKKIRDGEMQKIPYLLVVGDKEQTSDSVAVRERGKGDLGPMKLSEFIEKIKEEIVNKK